MEAEVSSEGWTGRWPVVAALLLLIPLVAWLANPDLAYSTLMRDSWIYHGYFLDLPGHLRVLRDSYYSTRLSMTLPGWLVYRCVGSEAGNYLLHLGVYLLGTLSMYVTVRQTVNQRAGLLAALLLGGQYHFLCAISSDYCDGYGMAYFLAATAAATLAIDSPRWRVWLFLSGMAGAALVVTNLSYVLLLGPLGLFLLGLNQSRRHQTGRSAILWLALGATILLVGLGLISHSLGGHFRYLRSSVTFVRYFTASGSNPFRVEWTVWLGRAAWLLLPAAAAIGAAVHLARSWGREGWRWSMAHCYQVMLLAMLAGLVGMEGTSQSIYLQCHLYAIAFLLPLGVLALAGQWAERITALSPREFLLLVGLAVSLPIVGAYGTTSVGWLVPVPVIFGTVVLAVLLPRLCPWQPAVAAALVLVLGADVVVGRGCNYRDREDVIRPQAARGFRRDVFRCIDEGMRTACELDPRYQAAYWYDEREPLGPLLDDVAGMGCWRFPNVLAASVSQAQLDRSSWPENRPVIVLASEPEALARAQRALGQLGLAGRMLKEWQTTSGPLRFRGYLLETRRDPAEAKVARKPTS